MTRGMWTKWVIGAALLSLIIAAGCFLWYQHTTAQYKAEADKDDKLLKQWKANKAKPPAETEEIKAPAESITPSAEKILSKTTETESETSTSTNSLQDVPMSTQESEKISPHGFGPYPEVPEDYFRRPSWLRYSNYVGRPGQEATAFEIMDRVLIKLWNQGHKNITGASFSGGMVYPNYANTAYVRYKETILHDGTLYRYVTKVKGGPDIAPFIKQIKKGNTPAHIKLLDYESAGINPFTFLKGEDRND